MKSDYPRTARERDETSRMLARVYAGSYDRLREMFIRDYEGDPGIRPDHVRVARHRGRIAAHVAVYERPIHIGRATFRMGGIGGVACVPECRGKGYASRCMRDSLEVMRRRGMTLSFLFGIDRFYLRFGYVGCLPRYELVLRCDALEELRSRLPARPYAPGDLDELVGLYAAAAAATPGAADRDRRRFAHAIKRFRLVAARGRDHRNAITVFAEKGRHTRVRAYVVWRDGSLLESAMAPGDEAACESVLAWMRDRRSESVEKELVAGTLAPTHPLWRYALRFNHTARRSLSWTGGGMGHIVDVRQFLDGMRPELERRIDGAGISAECHLHLSVDGTEHSLLLCKSHHITSAAASVMTASVRCSRQSLLQMALGTLPFGCIPDVHVSGTRALVEAAFPPSSPTVYHLDRF